MRLTNNSARVLIVDDNTCIHDDFRKILTPDDSSIVASVLDQMAATLFGESKDTNCVQFELDFALQGEEAINRVISMQTQCRPYALAFMDVRMPPGIDGIKAASKILEIDDAIQVVLCTAYTDYGSDELVSLLGNTDRVLLLKKPFDSIEVRQMAHALRHKWVLSQQAALKLADLEQLVEARTRELRVATEQLMAEMKERQRIESEHRLSQKLEAIGQLAAGIAHEINTPIQYVGDNVHFLGTAFEDMLALIDNYTKLIDPMHTTAAASARQQADWDYLVENVPKAFDRAKEGIGRVAHIVRAMKEFAHPDAREKSPIDINHAIHNTLLVSNNEYKLVADIDLELSDLPPVMCHAGDINQVFLNLIVNAAHAVSDVVSNNGSRGKIGIKTTIEGNFAVISISDTGCGIPDEISQRIYDPFFTTKEVGRGTGQGLAIARSIVVDKHQGSLSFSSQVGCGTTFYIKLPLNEDTVSMIDAGHHKGGTDAQRASTTQYTIC